MNRDWLNIAGRVCVVTGAGGGIGRTIAQSIADAGGKVCVVDRDIPAAKETVAQIASSGGTAVAIECDITDASSVERANNEAEKAFGQCTVLVNNAALVRNGPLAELSLADWNALLNVNLTGFFICSQIFGRGMRQNGGGSIVHVSSLAGSFPQPTSGAYSVSKAGVLMLSRHIALEWGEMGIRSNVVSPAMVITPMSEVIYRDPAVKAMREKAVPVRRIGQPQDIADAICFLASDRASYVSGQEILVDGGWSAALLTTVPRPGFDLSKKAE
jgi:NAD(P)-dependent dehydrogenase (short-subunit alcohol dehydrogenase family)